MTENDFIAEYVKEKHPGLLGADFVLWKIGKVVTETVRSFRSSLASIDWKSIAESVEKAEEAIEKEEAADE